MVLAHGARIVVQYSQLLKTVVVMALADDINR